MKKAISLLLTLCLVLGLAPAALGSEPAGKTTFQYTWSQTGDTHTVTRVDDSGDTVMEDGQPAFVHSGTSARDAIWAVYDDAEGAHQVLSFVLTLTSDVTLVGDPKAEGNMHSIGFGGGTVYWELSGYTLKLKKLILGAGKDNVTTFHNGTVKAEGTDKFPMLDSKYNGALILDDVTVSRDDGGSLVAAGNEAKGIESVTTVTIKDSTLTTGVSGMDASIGNTIGVQRKNASMTLENTTVTGHALTYPTASVAGGTLTVDGNSSITATAENVAAAIVRDGELYLNGGTLTPGKGTYACAGRTNGTLRLSGSATVSSVELRAGDQIVDDGYTGGPVALTCTDGREVGDLLVTGCTSEEAAKKFSSSAQNTVGLSYVEHNGGYAVVAAVKADDYTMTQDMDGYKVTGSYKSGETYVLVDKEPSFQTTINALFNDVQGTGATINLGGDVTIAGIPKGDGSYPTTGVGDGWITWDLQGHTLSLNNLCMIALIDGVLTVQNGTVSYTGDEVSLDAALFAAQDNGQMILEGVTASRDNGGRLLGVYSGPEKEGASVTATGCTLTTGDLSKPNPATGYGSNAILAREGSAVTLADTTVTSGAAWPTASLVGGSLRLDGSSTVQTTATGIDAALAQEGATLCLDGGRLIPATGGNAAQLQSGSTLSLSGNAVAEKVQLMDDSVVVAHNGAEGADRRYYTGADVGLQYFHTEGDSMTPQLVTGCRYADTAKKFLLGTDGAPYASYRREADGSYTVIEGRSLLDLTDLSGATGTYAIHDKLDMQWLSRLAAKGTANAHLHLYLTRDIDLKGGPDDPWTPIGSDAAPFQVDFHGGGHTISGLYIGTDANDQGLFGVVGRDGSVSDLTVTGTVRGGDYVGGVAGRVKSGKITACRSDVSVSGTSNVGGVVGELSTASAVVERSCSTGSVSATGDFAGGIAGQAAPATTIQDCFNTGDVSARSFAGGLAGNVINMAVVQNCFNTGDVSADTHAGGISGQLTPTTETKRCVSLGLSVSGGADAGRVVGKVQGSTTLAGNFARSDLSLTGGAMTDDTARQNGVDGESVALSGGWQKTAFAGWDFDAVWNEGSGDTLPTLKGSEGGVTVPRRASGGGGGSVSSKPTVTAGEGGTVKADGKGSVTMIPNEGWRIASVTVNGKAVEIPKDGVLTGLKSQDKVEVTFEVIPTEPILTPGQFTDLDPDAWYYDAVSYVLANGLFHGTSEKTFSPGVPMSRAMIFTVLHRMSGEEGIAADGTPWYAPALAWAMENGISDGSDPDGEITREQLATMLYRCAKTLPGYTPEGSGDAASFPDYDLVSSYAEVAVQWAVGHGILTGKDNGTLDPAGTATRAETAVMLRRFIERNAK